MTEKTQQLLEAIHFNSDGLVCAIAQDAATQGVLMQAWMNAESLQRTVQTGQAWYWSRSRQSLWRKGETSGHTQQVLSLRLDCDGDCLLLQVEQVGAACHTGRQSCFYNDFSADKGLQIIMPVLDT